MPPTRDTLDRFHQVLLHEISESRPEYLTTPFTVAEIYQNLVPYRSHRDLIGVEMNGDYEDILLRLLAGEGDYLVLDSEVARREIREELESPNPNTGLFRDFAAVDVRLNPDRILAGAVDRNGDPQREEEDGTSLLEIEPQESEVVVDIAELSPDEDGGEVGGVDAPEVGASGEDGVVGHIDLVDVGFLNAMPGTEAEEIEPQGYDASEASSGEDASEALAKQNDVPDEPGTFAKLEQPGVPERSAEPESEQIDEPEESGELAAPEEPEGVAAPAASDEGEPSACHWCRQNLPSRELLNFCPFCGSDMRLFPCPKCGEELEPGWQFCVSCGTEVSGE